MRKLSGFLARLRGDKRGAAVIETALVLPVLLTFAFGFIDLTQAFAFRMSLQEHAQAGADLVIAYGESVPADTEIKEAISQYSEVPVDSIFITRTIDCNGKSASTTSNSCPNADDLRVDYMTIKIEGAYQPMLEIEPFANFVPHGQMAQSATVRLP